ncbi:MAG TPA: ABC transporter ATP-binding protein, partial [Thermodesulfobacteriota bacterium]|jgi:putative ABC transport system ATP-binding protein|nr:ABC transporter ATP-binding protein [Thermodesulfobacteriota bacterium]
MIELRDITKTYRKNGEMEVRVLQGVSLDIKKGEFVAIMAPSGMGKTTLMNILGCLDRPTSGTYRFEGVEVEKLDDDQLSLIRNEKIGFVFQTFNLLPRASSLENVELPMIYSPRSGDISKKAIEALKAVGLGDRIYYKPSELSGGQQQRVAIARALVNNPSIILADEPTGNLDTASSEEIMAIFEGLHREDRTLIVVTHEADIAKRAKRLIEMKDGKVVQDKKIG